MLVSPQRRLSTCPVTSEPHTDTSVSLSTGSSLSLAAPRHASRFPLRELLFPPVRSPAVHPVALPPSSYDAFSLSIRRSAALSTSPPLCPLFSFSSASCTACLPRSPTTSRACSCLLPCGGAGSFGEGGRGRLMPVPQQARGACWHCAGRSRGRKPLLRGGLLSLLRLSLRSCALVRPHRGWVEPLFPFSSSGSAFPCGEAGAGSGGKGGTHEAGSRAVCASGAKGWREGLAGWSGGSKEVNLGLADHAPSRS